MGKVNYETWATRGSQNKESNFQKVGFFKLDNDGDEALVRFAYNSPNEFDIADIHRSKDKNGFWRNISCLRTPNEPLENCPLCAAKESLKTRFFVKLIQYTKDENGKVIVTPKVWERPSGFIKEVKNLITEYGDLKDIVFKIKRNGAKFNAKGEPNTDVTYSIMYQPPHIYKEELGYIKDFSAFDNFDVSKHSYAVRTADEIKAFLETGEFPVRVKKEEVKVEEKPVTPTPVQDATQVTSSKLDTVTVNDDGEVVDTAQVTEAVSADPTNGRPRRTYSWPENK